MPTIDPPDDGVSAGALVITQTATTRLKEIIAAAAAQGWKGDRVVRELNRVIADCRARLMRIDAALAESTRHSLQISARKWFYQLASTYDILNRNFARRWQLNDKTYSLQIAAFFRDRSGSIVTKMRPYLDDGTNFAIPLIEDYRQKLQTALKALSAEPPKTVRMQNGKAYEVSARNLAEMTVRYEANRADLDRLRAAGVRFVWTTSHPNCSPRCASYQGRLWSLDGSSGVLEGHRYSPIEPALAGPNRDGNGIITGYNCRHRLVAWEKGSEAPAEFSEAEIRREYAIDRRQRAYENNIRQLKTEERLLRASGDAEAAGALRRKWRRCSADYRIYSLEHGRAYYPYRCMVDEAEQTEASLYAPKEQNDLTIPPVQGILVTDETFNGIVEKRVRQAAPAVQSAWARCAGKIRIADAAYAPQNGPSARYSRGGIYFDRAADGIQSASHSAWSDFFHEAGHALDAALGAERGGSSYSALFRSAKYTREQNGQTVGYTLAEMAREEAGAYLKEAARIREELRAIPDHQGRAVSDAFSGATENVLHGNFVHRGEYWRIPDKLGKELFAHFVEGEVNTPESLYNLRDYFPRTYEIFVEMMEAADK